jgi:hypothetical protein
MPVEIETGSDTSTLPISYVRADLWIGPLEHLHWGRTQAAPKISGDVAKRCPRRNKENPFN